MTLNDYVEQLSTELRRMQYAGDSQALTLRARVLMATMTEEAIDEALVEILTALTADDIKFYHPHFGSSDHNAALLDINAANQHVSADSLNYVLPSHGDRYQLLLGELVRQTSNHLLQQPSERQLGKARHPSAAHPV